MIKPLLTFGAVALFGLVTITSNAKVKKSDTNPHGIDVTNLNPNVKPGTDFFDFATAGWNKKHPLPADQSRYGSFNYLIDENDKRIREIIETTANKSSDGVSVESKVGVLFNQYLDTERLNSEGIKPLMKYVNEIDALPDDQLSLMIGKLARYGVSCFFLIGTEADAKDSKMNLVQLMQGGLSMGQRDYYLDSDEPTAKIREAYKVFGEKVFGKLYPKASPAELTKKMGDVINIETRLARSFKTNAALRVPEDNYHKMSYDGLKKDYVGVNFDDVLRGCRYRPFTEINVGQPEALNEVMAIFKEEPASAIKNYMIFRASVNALNYLSDDLRSLHFDFYGKTMAGIEQEQPRWKDGVNLCNGLLGEAIGKLYAAKYFPEEAKQRMKTLVSNLQQALGERILAQDWMSDVTKQKALEKLGSFYVKIGYPDKWRDWSELQVSATNSLLDNVLITTAFNEDYYADKTVNRPVDRDQWYMTPQTVNAYYNPPTNEICFPAGILQYPFFDMKADDAFNYGAIGVVIGHEMTHGFDDQGRKYDKEGNMVEWWSADDSRRFNERAQVIIDFFNNIKVLPDLNGNGPLTAGENLADHGGLQVAFTAFKNATKNQALKKYKGFSAEQRFFIAYAGVWAGSIREAEIRKRTKMDPHSLGRWRVNGALPHIDAWYDAFGIKASDPLFVPKDKRVTIW
jgi:putative endopeptidase